MENENVQQYDDLDDFSNEEQLNEQQINNTKESQHNEVQTSDDFITTLLENIGIHDRSKIKFEDEDGQVSEYNWDDLDTKEKLNIIYSSKQDPNTDLDDAETQLINTIRKSGLTPAEYLENLQQQGVNNYIQNKANEQYQYEIDQFSDDELFISDLISKAGDITDEEAKEALEKAKSNETLYAKQIAALRNEYREIEEQNKRQAQLEQEEQAQEEYKQFADSIAEQIGEFNEFSGYDLNLEDNDRDMLYEFITGFDDAGNNYFAKALADPKILVKAAWLTLNGEQVIEDITSYFQKEIEQVRTQSYNKGLEDSANKKSSHVVFKNTNIETRGFDDLDNF